MRYLLLTIFFLLGACSGGGGNNAPYSPRLNSVPLPASFDLSSLDKTESTGDDYFKAGGAWSKANGDADIMEVLERPFETDGLFGRAIKTYWQPADDDPMTNKVTAFAGKARFEVPPLEIREIWQQGWTGEGINIAVLDNIQASGNFHFHGMLVGASALSVAPRANLFALQRLVGGVSDTASPDSDLPIDINGQTASGGTQFKVANISLAYGEDTNTSRLNKDEKAIRLNGTSDVFNDVAGDSPRITGLADAVITKSASNNSHSASLTRLTLALVRSDKTADRTLIVGGLDGYPDDNNPARPASYTNFPGKDEDVRNRFVVENGESPFISSETPQTTTGINNGEPYTFFGGIAGFGGNVVSTDAQGTSFASPRVAGYAAIIRQKFSNLTGAQTTSLMLSTATYRGLAQEVRLRGITRSRVCINRNACTLQDVYGRGRIDLPAALSPKGDLK